MSGIKKARGDISTIFVGKPSWKASLEIPQVSKEDNIKTGSTKKKKCRIGSNGRLY
jgi:hypothetical protein